MKYPSKQWGVAVAQGVTGMVGLMSIVVSVGSVTSAHAHVLPEGATTRHGQVAFAMTSPGTLSIVQRSKSATVDWASFSIGSRASVLITQPGHDAMLVNRVVGDSPSVLEGNLIAIGSVVLLNPNGIAITSTGSITSAGFLASTLPVNEDALSKILTSGNTNDLHDDVQRLLHIPAQQAADDENGSRRAVTIANVVAASAPAPAVAHERALSRSAYDVIHNGNIGLTHGGSAVLVGSGIKADGKIVSQAGRVAMVTRAAPPAAALLDHASGQVPRQTPDGVSILADASASAQASVQVPPAIRVFGTAQTSCHLGGQGQVLVDAGNQSVHLSGELVANSVGGRGGRIEVRGSDIKIDGALLSVTGGNGGGDIMITTAATPTHNAHIDLSGSTLLYANAAQWGKGGNIAVTTLGDLYFDAVVKANGERDGNGPAFAQRDIVRAGEGGGITLQGGTDLSVQGEIIASGARGAAVGTVALHAHAPRVKSWSAAEGAAGESDNSAYSVADTGLLHSEGAGYANKGIDARTVGQSLQHANVVIYSELANAVGAPSDIRVQSPITWTSDNALIMHSAGNIRINARVHGAGDHAAAHFLMPPGKGWEHKGGAVTLTGAAPSASINGVQYRLLSNANDMVAALSSGVGVNYALAAPLDLASVNIQPIVMPSGKQFMNFDGMGNTLFNMRIHAPTVKNVGLFGTLGDRALVSNMIFVNAQVTGGENVGILSGAMEGKSVATALTFVNGRVELAPAASLSTLADRVKGHTAVGGITGVMRDRSRIRDVTGTVFVAGDENVGGVVGFMASASDVSAVSMTGSVAGAANVGGIVGHMSGNGCVEHTHWDGVVSHRLMRRASTGGFGGIVGYQKAGSVVSSLAAGWVFGRVSAGGLVGVAGGDAVLRGCHVANQVGGSGFLGAVSGIVTDRANLTSIRLDGMDHRLPHVGRMVGYGDRALPNGHTNGRGHSSSALRTAEIDTHYVAGLVSPPLSPREAASSPDPIVSASPGRWGSVAEMQTLQLPNTVPGEEQWPLLTSPRVSPQLSPVNPALESLEPMLLDPFSSLAYEAAVASTERGGYQTAYDMNDVVPAPSPAMSTFDTQFDMQAWSH